MDSVHENMGTIKHLSGRQRLNDVGNTHDLLRGKSSAQREQLV